MTYKEAIDSFNVLYSIRGGDKKLSFEKVLMLLSIPYADLANRYRLAEKRKQLQLAANTYSYGTGSGNNNIPSDLMDIRSVIFNEGGSNHYELIKEERLPLEQRTSGLPTRYSIELTNGNRNFVIDALPDQSYSASNGYYLNIYYFAKIFRYSGAAENSFSDVDFASSAFGGSFLTPTEWDNAIIAGALAQALPTQENILDFNQAVKNARESKPVYMKSSLDYHLGI